MPKQPLSIRIIPVTPFQQNCSLVWDTETKKGVLIDPGGEAEKILHGVKKHGVDVQAIWLTHGHLDHAGGAMDVKAALDVPIIGPHKDDQFWLDQIEASWAKYGQAGMGKDCTPDRYLEDGERLSFGDWTFDVIHTPGHTPGHVVFYNKDMDVAFVGDVLFRGSIGRTDFERSNHQDLLDSITQKLWPLGAETRFVCGHGPTGTFGEERRSNPYVSDQAIQTARARTSGIM